MSAHGVPAQNTRGTEDIWDNCPHCGDSFDAPYALWVFMTIREQLQRQLRTMGTVKCLLGLLLVPALTACAHTSGVSDMGAGIYAVTGTETGTQQRGTAAARADAVDQATAFCAKSGRKPVIQGYDDKPLTAWGAPTSSVVFRCE
jgi:hypothetical protein